jgi:hypothetical protein
LLLVLEVFFALDLLLIFVIFPPIVAPILAMPTKLLNVPFQLFQSQQVFAFLVFLFLGASPNMPDTLFLVVLAEPSLTAFGESC